MVWRILVYERDNKYYSLHLGSISIYEGMLKNAKSSGMRIILSRDDIPDECYDGICDLVSKLIGRKNSGEALNLEKEMGRIFQGI